VHARAHAPTAQPHANKHPRNHARTTTGTPIAALCEHEGDVPAVAAAAPGLRSIPDLYDDEGVRCSGMQPFVQLLEWQSFLKDDKGAGGSGSCGCM
jgi:hypothetical protein